MIRSALARIGLIAVVLAVTGCTMGTDEAKQGVAEFGARVSRQSFGEIYRGARAGPQAERAVVGFRPGRPARVRRRAECWRRARCRPSP